MYLSKIKMDVRYKAVKAAIRDAQAMHRLLTGLHRCKRQDAGLLYLTKMDPKDEGKYLTVYMYANKPIDATRLCPFMHLENERNIAERLDSIREGDVYTFDLTTMPFKKVDGKGKNKARVSIEDPERRSVWLEKKMRDAGCELVTGFTERHVESVYINHDEKCGGDAVLKPFRYTGYVKVMDAEKLRSAIENGIGPDRAYGLGMLLIG